MQRLFNIIIILAVYFGILYNKNLKNKRTDTVKHTKVIHKKKIVKHYSKNSVDDLY